VRHLKGIRGEVRLFGARRVPHQSIATSAGDTSG
jgi:hypothetical protein